MEAGLPIIGYVSNRYISKNPLAGQPVADGVNDSAPTATA